MVREENKAGVPIGHLFREGRAVATIVFWVVNFMNLLNLYSAGELAADGRARRGLLGTDRRGARRHGAPGRRHARRSVGLAPRSVARRGFVRVMSATFVVAAHQRGA